MPTDNSGSNTNRTLRNQVELHQVSVEQDLRSGGAFCPLPQGYLSGHRRPHPAALRQVMSIETWQGRRITSIEK